MKKNILQTGPKFAKFEKFFARKVYISGVYMYMYNIYTYIYIYIYIHIKVTSTKRPGHHATGVFHWGPNDFFMKAVRK